MNNKKVIYLIIGIVILIIIILGFILYNNRDINFIINDKNILLKIGETKKIDYSLNRNNINIIWSSNNDSVTINEVGEVTANSYGDAIITGKILDGDKEIIDTCTIKTYSGEEGVAIQEISVPEGYLLMKPSSSYQLPFTIVPSNAYITSINYTVSDNNVLEVKDNLVISKQEGEALLSMIVNNNINNKILVKVTSKVNDNKIVKMLKDIIFDDKELTMEMGDKKKLNYTIDPVDSYVEEIIWSTDNEKVVKIVDGEVEAINMGEAKVTAKVNNIEASVKITVKVSKEEMIIDTYPKTTIKVGETTNIKAHLSPKGINDKIEYTSNNTNVIKVGDNGSITGVNKGSAIVTLKISNGKTKNITMNVNPRSGSINGTGNLWGYKTLDPKVPVLADRAFYQKLMQNGTGTLQNNTYTISSEGLTFTYDIANSLLSVSNKRIKVRVYYPPNEDLSTINTLVYMGGRGETNFGGIFSSINKNPSMVKSAGIIVLLAEGNNTNFDGASGAYTTKFVQAITKQKKGAKNSILGFSDGAHKVMHASKLATYDKIIVFSGYVDGAGSLENAKNSEVLFIIAPSDGNYSQAQSALWNMRAGYKNVTIMSIGTDMATKFSSHFLVINPGSLMKNGHLSENVMLSGIIEYAND